MAPIFSSGQEKTNVYKACAVSVHMVEMVLGSSGEFMQCLLFYTLRFSFIKLIDYYVQRTYHRLMKNSIILLMCELEVRTSFIPKEFSLIPKHKFKYQLLRHKNEKMVSRSFSIL
jgi:hypothetical protein